MSGGPWEEGNYHPEGLPVIIRYPQLPPLIEKARQVRLLRGSRRVPAPSDIPFMTAEERIAELMEDMHDYAERAIVTTDRDLRAEYGRQIAGCWLQLAALAGL